MVQALSSPANKRMTHTIPVILAFTGVPPGEWIFNLDVTTATIVPAGPGRAIDIFFNPIIINYKVYLIIKSGPEQSGEPRKC
jgi:hypothetical protein